MIYTSKMIETINNGFYPKSDIRIARYMGFNRFQQLVENKALWMANRNFFDDKNEGAIPASFFKKWEKETANNYSSLQKLKNRIYTAYISCWFEYERESELMWLAYGGTKSNKKRDSNGICIITDVGKLATFTHDLDARVYKVHYINYMESEKIEPPFYFSKNIEEKTLGFSGRVFYVYKQKEYSSENEIRAITYKKSKVEGIYANINPVNFIDKIIINPHASKQQTELIIAYLENHGLIDKLIESKIICKS